MYDRVSRRKYNDEKPQLGRLNFQPDAKHGIKVSSAPSNASPSSSNGFHALPVEVW